MKQIGRKMQMGKKEEIRYLVWGKPGEMERIRIKDYEIIPCYFQWDRPDLKILKFSEYRKVFIKLAAAYFKMRYREVFLEHTETLFLSEKARKEIPRFLWEKQPVPMQKLHICFAGEIFFEIVEEMQEKKQEKKQRTIVLAIPGEGNFPELEEWMERLQEKDFTRIALTDFILLGNPYQKDRCEEILDAFYEQTGIAGSFYSDVKEYRRGMGERVCIGENTRRDILFLDCLGVPVKELGRVNFYIDGAGMKSKGEIRKLEMTGVACKSLYKHLDSTFLSKL